MPSTRNKAYVLAIRPNAQLNSHRYGWAVYIKGVPIAQPDTSPQSAWRAVLDQKQRPRHHSPYPNQKGSDRILRASQK